MSQAADSRDIRLATQALVNAIDRNTQALGKLILIEIQFLKPEDKKLVDSVFNNNIPTHGEGTD